MGVHVENPCPTCGNELPGDEAVWLFHGHFYCKVECAFEASKLPALIDIPKGLA